MLNALRRLFSSTTPVAAPAPVATTVVPATTSRLLAQLDTPAPRYPAQQAGFPGAAVDELLATQAEMIASIQQPSGLTDEEFARFVVPVVRRYAEAVHLLPASESYHHAGVGGLLRHGLEVAWNAARISQARVFAAQHEPERAYHLRPRWRLAAVLAGLLHDIGKPISDIEVLDRSGIRSWDPFDGPLANWLTREGVDEYWIAWRGDRNMRHAVYGMLVVREVLGSDVIRWLKDPPAGREVSDGLFDAVTGGNDPTNPLVEIVRRADQHSVQEDLTRVMRAATASGGGSRHMICNQLLAGLQQLAGTPKWMPNRPGGPIWVTQHGVFLVYPLVLKEVVTLLTQKNIRGIPTDENLLATKLVDQGILEPQILPDGRARATWIGDVPQPGTEQVARLYLIKLAQPGQLLAHLPAPHGITLLDDAGQSLDAPKARPDVASSPPPTAPTSTAPPAPSGPPSRAAETRAALAAPAGRAEPAAAQLDLAIAPAPSAIESTGSAAAAAVAWLGKSGLAGEMVRAVAEDLASGERRWDTDAFLLGDRVGLLWPSGLRDLGMDATRIATAFREKGWLEIDPLQPARMTLTRDVAGKPTVMIVLLGEAAAHLIAISRGAKGTATHGIDLAAPAPSSNAELAREFFAFVSTRHARKDYLALRGARVNAEVEAYADARAIKHQAVYNALFDTKLIVGKAADTAINADYVPAEERLWLDTGLSA